MHRCAKTGTGGLAELPRFCLEGKHHPSSHSQPGPRNQSAARRLEGLKMKWHRVAIDTVTDGAPGWLSL